MSEFHIMKKVIKISKRMENIHQENFCDEFI